MRFFAHTDELSSARWTLAGIPDYKKITVYKLGAESTWPEKNRRSVVSIPIKKHSMSIPIYKTTTPDTVFAALTTLQHVPSSFSYLLSFAFLTTEAPYNTYENLNHHIT